MHDGKSASYLSAVAAALSLNKIKNSVSVLQIGAIGIGIAFAAVFSFVAGGAELSVVPLVITQAVFSVIGFISTKAKIRKK
jgi:L-cysteine desulfidase